MHINDHGKQRISRNATWIAVIFVVLLLGGMGVAFMSTGHVPSAPRWVWIAELPLVIGGSLFRLWRDGGKASSRAQWLFPIGFTLLALSNIFPNWAVSSLLGAVASVMFIVAFLSLYLTLGKHRQAEDAPPE